MQKSLLPALILMLLPLSTASAQITGMPLWNDPHGGTGITISGDAGFPEPDGYGTVLAVRANAGLGTLQAGLTAGTRNPDEGDNVSSFGATLGSRLFGGPLVPIAVNLQGGFATEKPGEDRITRITAAAGAGLKLPVPGLNLQAWISPGVRFLRTPRLGGDGSLTKGEFGIAGGVNLGLGLIGLHVGVDHENAPGDEKNTTFGVGVHVNLKAPVGL
jgi:hypothetical protein